MTKRQMTRLISEYQQRMLCGHWHLEVEFDVEPEGIEYASIGWSYQYDSAVLRLCKGWRKWDDEKARRILAHEFIHLLERDLQVAIRDQEEFWGAGWDQFYARWTHELEGLTERLATIVSRAA